MTNKKTELRCTKCGAFILPEYGKVDGVPNDLCARCEGARRSFEALSIVQDAFSRARDAGCVDLFTGLLLATRRPDAPGALAEAVVTPIRNTLTQPSLDTCAPLDKPSLLRAAFNAAGPAYKMTVHIAVDIINAAIWWFENDSEESERRFDQ